MVLTDVAVKNAKPGSKVIRLKDERGLYPKGGKWWRLRYWINSKERLLSLGVYPDVSLKMARERRDDARRLIAEGIDPGEQRKRIRAEAANQAPKSRLLPLRLWLVNGTPSRSRLGAKGTP